MPTAEQIIFIIVAAMTLGAALMVVTRQNLVHAALWLVLALFGIAVFYVLLNAGFLAVAQVVIYIGAIAILMIFAIMLTRRVASPESGPALTRNWPYGLVLGLLSFGGLVWLLVSWAGFHTPLPDMPAGVDPLTQLGIGLVDPNGYVLPFELASVLLLAAMIGAIVIAWDRNQS
jgi:NADH-quinone oxidoreductase subunit J